MQIQDATHDEKSAENHNSDASFDTAEHIEVSAEVIGHKKNAISKLAVFNFSLIIILYAGLGFLSYYFYNLTTRVLHNNNSNQTELRAEVDKLSADLLNATNKLDIQKNNIEDLQSLKNILEQRLSELVKSKQEIQRIRSIDWKFAEIEYLLRIANQELIVAQDKNMALRLMELAYAKINALNLASTLPINKALQKDIQRLTSVEQKSLADISIELLAISASVEQMQFLNLSTDEKAQIVHNSTNTDTVKKQSNFMQKIWLEIKSLVIIKTQSTEIKPLMDIEAFSVQKQRLISLLTQASWASLHKNQALYDTTLTASIKILNGYLSNDVNAKAFSDKLVELKQIVLNVDEKTYSNALQELEEFLAQRYKLTNSSAQQANTLDDGDK